MSKSLPRRMVLIVSVQIFLLVVGYFCAFLLRFDLVLDHPSQLFFWKTLAPLVFLKLVFFYLFGLLRGWWRYVGLSDLLDISKASASSVAVLLLLLQIGFWPQG